MPNNPVTMKVQIGGSSGSLTLRASPGIAVVTTGAPDVTIIYL